MLNKVPIIIGLLAVVFLIVSLLTIITMDRIVIKQEIEKEQTVEQATQPKIKTSTGFVKIKIAKPPTPVTANAAVKIKIVNENQKG